MENQQFLARIGIFALIGLNVGAYYVFWPSQDSATRTEAKAPQEVKGTAQLVPTSVPQPKDLPAKAASSAVPLNIADAPKMPEPAGEDPVSKLLDHIKKEKEGSVAPKPFDDSKFTIPNPPTRPPGPGDLPVLPMIPDDGKPKPLPPLKPAGDLQPANDRVGVTSPLTPKVPEAASMWKFDVTKPLSNGGSLAVIAKMTDRPLKWNFSCTKFEPGTGGADAVAEDAVLATEVGVSIRSKRMTFAYALPRITFDGAVTITPAGTTYGMQSERVVWDFPLRPAGTVLGPPK